MRLRPGVYDVSPYPIICDFEDWQFPHGGLPGAWAHLNQTLSETKSPSSGCIMTGVLTKDMAHLIPQASASWFRRNRMGDYLTNPRGAFGPDNEANICRLRGDLLKDFDELAFAFVPKFTRRGCRLVAHYLSAADDLICPASIFHNQMTYQLDKIAPEFLLSRFAYAVFGLLHGFTAQTARRLAIVEPGEDELGLCAWVHNVYTMTPAEVAARRTELARRSISKKRTLEEAGIDDEVPIGLSLNEQLIMGHEQLVERPSEPVSSLATPRQVRNIVNHGSRPQQLPKRPIRFTDLPPEARLMIWEATWPEPRVIEIVTIEHDNPETGDIDDHARLQLFGSISSWLTSDHSWRPADSRPEKPRNSFRQLPDENAYPIALSICSESRTHTLKSFYRMRHYNHPGWSFYFNPTCDILWLSDDLWNLEEEDVTELSTSYGRQLADVQNVILSVNGWSEIADLEILRLLGGVNIIQILLGVNQTPADVLQLQHRVQLQFGDDERWCFVFRFVDRLYNPCGEVAVGRIRH